MRDLVLGLVSGRPFVGENDDGTPFVTDVHQFLAPIRTSIIWTLLNLWLRRLCNCEKGASFRTIHVGYDDLYRLEPTAASAKGRCGSTWKCR
jgi:hypothetical protein